MLQPRILIKTVPLRWIRHVESMIEAESVKLILRQVPEEKIRSERPKICYMDQIRINITILRIRNWKVKSQNRVEWKKILKQAKILQRLSKQWWTMKWIIIDVVFHWTHKPYHTFLKCCMKASMSQIGSWNLNTWRLT